MITQLYSQVKCLIIKLANITVFNLRLYYEGFTSLSGETLKTG